MSTNERRRRPQLRVESGKTGRFTAVLSPSPSALPWIAFAFAAISGLLVALTVDGGDRPFPYVLGQRVDRDLRLREPLRIPNETATRQRREEAAAAAPIAYRLDPQPTLALLERLKVLIGAVAATSEFGGVDPKIRAEWELTHDAFANLREIANKPAQVEGAVAKLQQLFDYYLLTGIMDVQPSLEQDLRKSAPQAEIILDGKSIGTKQIDELLLTELAQPNGKFGQQFMQAFGKGGPTLFAMVVRRLKPNLVQDPQRTLDNRNVRWDAVDPVEDLLERGTLVLEQGQIVDEDAMRILREEHRKLRSLRSWWKQPERLVGNVVVVGLLLGAAWTTLCIYRPGLATNPTHVVAVCSAILTATVLARLLRTPPYYADVLPVAVASLLWAVAFDRVYAAGLAFVLSFLVARMHPEPMYLFPILLAGTLAGALSLNAVRSRTKLMKVGAIAGLAYFIVAVAEGIIADQPIGLVLREAAWRGGGGVIAGFFLSGCLPFVEQAFGIITAISLKELADNSHPLLRELVRKAPGTFNHSWTVSILGETAAKAIGCDSELVRVGAVFHDIGKMNKAQYFIENKAPEERNRHDLLAPAMSTLVIIGHVKDGLDLGRQHHLPQPILDMIEQHHGTTRVDYFYREATRAFRENPDPDEEVEESAFRYPGPRPQSKEAAVLMLTDCVESATRALSEPTPARIEKLVHSLAMNRLLDGQFDESGLTLQELRTVEESLTKSLASVYHGRVKYTAAV